MSPETTLQRRERARLIADGCVLTSGSFAAVLLLALGLVAIFGPPTESNPILSLVSVVLMTIGGAAGVVAAWLLHGRRITGAALVGGVAGGAVGGMTTPLVAFLAYLIGLPLRLVTAWEFAGPVVVLAIVAMAFIWVVVWVLLDAVRDLRGVEHAHVRLDQARIAAASLVAALAAVVAVAMLADPSGEMGEAIIFVFLAGAVGAAVVAGADIASGIATQSRESAGPAAA